MANAGKVQASVTFKLGINGMDVDAWPLILRPGDALVLVAREPMSDDDVQSITDALAALGVCAIVVSGFERVAVQRAGDAPAEPQKYVEFLPLAGADEQIIPGQCRECDGHRVKSDQPYPMYVHKIDCSRRPAPGASIGPQ